ncbi:MAG: hypothetical protein ABID63_18710 [Pseudomonadota bacterium]
MKIRFLISVLCLIVLAGCGQVPRPFEGAGRESNPDLLVLRDAAAVRVEQAGDLPDGAGMHLARAMARALRGHDIPAFSDSQVGGDYILRPVVEARLAGAESASLDVTWVLYNKDMLAIESIQSPGDLAVEAWFAPPPEGAEEGNLQVPDHLVPEIMRLKGEKPDPVELAFDDLVAAPANAVASLIGGDRQAVKMALPMKIALFDFAGASGDGNEALLRSASAFLQNKGIEIGHEIDEQTVVLSASIEVKPANNKTGEAMDRVSITWMILDHGGAELGQMVQNNAVPHGRLDERWGSVASLAAQAAIDALEGALRQIASDRGLLLRADRQKS